jgi:hypothetical protein
MRKRYYLYPVLVLVVFLGIIQVASLTPYWNTSTRSVSAAPVGGNAPDGASDPVVVDTAYIKGMWTLADTATTFQVPAAEIKAHYSIPLDVPDSTAVKDLNKYNPDFETTLLREWLKERSPVAKK